MTIYGLDPGTEMSALVVLDTQSGLPHGWLLERNEDLLVRLRDIASISSSAGSTPSLSIEYVESMGMPVGRTTFATVLWAGRFMEAFEPHRALLIPRGLVKRHHCESRKANDSNIRQAIMDRFGGTREQAFGTKKAQGPLYGITSHKMQALAVALVLADMERTGAAFTVDAAGVVRLDEPRLSQGVQPRSTRAPMF